jgi:hypothetical protein
MKKNRLTIQQKTNALALHRETLRQLESAKLQAVAGGGRLRVPVGYADDTTPIYDDTQGGHLPASNAPRLRCRRRAFEKFQLVKLSAVLLTTLTTTASAAAAGRPSSPPQQLFEREQVAVDKTTHPQGSRWLVPDAVEEFVIQADPATLDANPAVLTIDLPDFPALEAVRTRFVEYRPDWKSWIGTLRIAGTKDEGSGYIHLGYHGDQITAMIDYEGKRFRILDGRLVRLSEDSGPPPCAVESSQDPAKILRFDTEALQQNEDGLGLATAALGTHCLDASRSIRRRSSA